MHRRRARHVALALATLALASILPAARAQTGVGVSIGIVQPGVYGRIDIGSLPAPAVIYPQPVVVVPSHVAVVQRPIYLYVPPGHQKHWSRHCAKYGACGQPVYFVQESWVRGRYDHGHGHDKHHKKHDD
jgi:hypothetical protein